MRLQSPVFLFFVVLAMMLRPIVSLHAAEDKILVAELSFVLKAKSEEVRYYGFNDGDELIFDFREENKKVLTDMEVGEFGFPARFRAHDQDRIKNHTLPVARKAVYFFRLSNGSTEERSIRLSIWRRPSKPSRIKFNTNVVWRTVNDTTWQETTEKYLAGRDTAVDVLMDRVTRVHSRTTWDLSDNYAVVDFKLPANTVAWSYWLGVGEEGRKAYDEASQRFFHGAAGVAMKVPAVGPLVALALEGVNYFSLSKSGDNLIYTLVADPKSLKHLKNGQPGVNALKQGNIVTDFGRLTPLPDGTAYSFFLKNDNIRDAIDVNLKVVAVRVTERHATRTVRKMKLTPRQVAVVGE